MTPESMNSLFELIEKFKPKLIDGYAESFNFIASAADIELRHSPLALMSSAQQLTTSTREKIENRFGAKVFDKYGSREFSGIAYQCVEGSNHHVQDESYIVELLVDGRPAQPGEVGEIVVTDLNNYSVPLIRYRIGDLAMAVSQDPCPCGRSQMMIGEITGRTQALIACSNEVWLPGTFFAHFFKDYEFAIKQYQVYQEEVGVFDVRIIPTSRYNETVEKQILASLQVYTSTQTLITIILVSEIPMEKTGKRTPVISRVSQDFQSLKPGGVKTKIN
jgi:phenylacetate-CoA ligase